RDAGATIFRTDLQGDIFAVSDGKTVTFTTSRQASQEEILQGTGGTSTSDPISATYVLNTNTMKFHYADCSSAQKISDKNKGYYTGSRTELIQLGYSPCGICKP
ncbi:MAG: MBL fold metallo-hydrolase, partial [Evtepia sp.]